MGNLWRGLMIVVFAVAGMALVGCSDDPEVQSANEGDRTTTTMEATTTTAPAIAEETRDYFEALAESNAEGGEKAQGLAEPESPAFFYALYLTETSRLASKFGPLGPGTVTVNGAEVRTCRTDPQEAVGLEVCFSYTDIAVNDAGQAVSFAVDGVPLAERMGVNGAPGSSSGVTAAVVVAYTTAQGGLALTVDVKNDAAATFDPLEANFVGPDGRQVPAESELSLQGGISSGANAYDVVFVKGGVRGGTLNYSGYLDTPDFTTVDIPLAVP